MRHFNRHCYRFGVCNLNKQGGSTLIVSLVLLLIVTTIGLASMQSTSLELKIASTTKERNTAYAAAEAALSEAEQSLRDGIIDIDRKNFYTSCSGGNCTSDCSGTGCFTESCQGGLCFAGNYNASMADETECEVNPSSFSASIAPQEFWKEDSYWTDTSSHFSVNVPGLNEPAKYIVEFMCFADSGRGGFTSRLRAANSKTVNNNLGEPIFRITSLAQSNTGRSDVMLQSIFMVVENP